MYLNFNYVKIVTIIRCQFLKEAAHYFQQCLVVNPNFIRARHNLDYLSNLAVENWHFRMLNDFNRNKSFQEAIIKKIGTGFNRVLDIGTGTGLLRCLLRVLLVYLQVITDNH